jgi:predicted amidophosphoribosyltransferase
MQVAEVMAGFLSDKPNALSRMDMIAPMPPSSVRSTQPVAEVATALGKRLNKPVVIDAVRKIRETPGLKGIHDAGERREFLDGAFEANPHVKGKGILLLDDLYRSGATANAVTLALLTAGASPVYFLAATRTRSNV